MWLIAVHGRHAGWVRNLEVTPEARIKLAGRWHDLGKYTDDFQEYLMSFATDPEVVDVSILDGKPGRVDHSSAGATGAHSAPWPCVPGW